MELMRVLKLKVEITAWIIQHQFSKTNCILQLPTAKFN